MTRNIGCIRPLDKLLIPKIALSDLRPVQIRRMCHTSGSDYEVNIQKVDQLKHLSPSIPRTSNVNASFE